MSGFEGDSQLGSFWFFLETQHSVIAVHIHNSEAGHFIGIDLNRCQGHIRSGVVVPLQHQAVVHLVDVIAREDEHVLGLLRADRVNVLVDRVGCALIPLVAHPLHGRQHFDELAQFDAHDVPTFADVAVQRQGLVLGKDVDPPQVGVDAIGEGDVDDAVDAAKGDGRFGAVASQRIQPLTRAAG